MTVPAMAVRWRRRAARPTTIASASHDGTDDHCGFAWKRSSSGGAPWNAPGQPQPRGAGGDSRLSGNQCDELQIARAAVGGGTSRLGADVCPRSGVFGGKLPVIAGNPRAFWPDRTRRVLAESPANRRDSSPARARIAPRRSPVRVRLAPSEVPGSRALRDRRHRPRGRPGCAGQLLVNLRAAAKLRRGFGRSQARRSAMGSSHLLPALGRRRIRRSRSTTSPSCCTSCGARAARRRRRRARWRRCRACCASRAAAVGSSPTRSSGSSTTSAPGRSAVASACSAARKSSGCLAPARRATG
jgi:hypothetical protein